MRTIIPGLGSCAWTDCTNEQCLTSTDLNTGRLVRLPACVEHAEVIKDHHEQYKLYGPLRKQLQRLVQKEADKEKELANLKLFNKLIKKEIDERLSFTKLIKRKYTDPQHLHHVHVLLEQAENTHQRIQEIEKKSSKKQKVNE